MVTNGRILLHGMALVVVIVLVHTQSVPCRGRGSGQRLGSMFVMVLDPQKSTPDPKKGPTKNFDALIQEDLEHTETSRIKGQREKLPLRQRQRFRRVGDGPRRPHTECPLPFCRKSQRSLSRKILW